MAAMEEFKAGQYEAAAASFAEVYAECPPMLTTWRVLARHRRAAAFFALQRWGDALQALDEILADEQALRTFRRDRFPDEIAGIHAARIGCLEMLQRWNRADRSIAALIDEVGSGATPNQQFYLADAYLFRAKAAIAHKELSVAFAALDSALRQSRVGDHPEMAKVRREADDLRTSLNSHVRLAP